jgi:hypothetical protein
MIILKKMNKECSSCLRKDVINMSLSDQKSWEDVNGWNTNVPKSNEKLTMEGIVKGTDVNFPTNQGQSLNEYLLTKQGKKVKITVEILD